MIYMIYMCINVLYQYICINGGLKDFSFIDSNVLGEDSHFDTCLSNGLGPSTGKLGVNVYFQKTMVF